MKRWFYAIIFSNLGRFFNNPQIVHNLEDRLANSGPIRQLARAIVALYQRTSWELKNLSNVAPKKLGQSEPISEVQAELLKKYKQFENEMKKKMEQKQ